MCNCNFGFQCSTHHTALTICKSWASFHICTVLIFDDRGVFYTACPEVYHLISCEGLPDSSTEQELCMKKATDEVTLADAPEPYVHTKDVNITCDNLH